METYEELYTKFSRGRSWAALLRPTCLELAYGDTTGTIDPESKLFDLINVVPAVIPIFTTWSLVAGLKNPLTGRVATRTPAEYRKVRVVLNSLRQNAAGLLGLSNERLVVAVFLRYIAKLDLTDLPLPSSGYERFLNEALFSKTPSYATALVWLMEPTHRVKRKLPDPLTLLEEPYRRVYSDWLR